MTESTREALPERSRWAAVRSNVRGWLAQRLRSDALAAQLLPVQPLEDPDASHQAVRPAWPSVAALAAEYPALLDPSLRKRRGAWFTPTGITGPTVARTLQPLLPQLREAPLQICDPAVGAGAFLLAALQWQRTHGVPTRRAAANLCGVDVDSTAAAIAAVTLWEACGDEAPDVLQLAAQVRAGDGLHELPPGSCDAVLTNPPWETLQASEEARRAVAGLRSRFHHQGNGKLYTYRLFVERCHELLRDDGRFGLVVPASLWFDRDARPLRELLLDTCRWEWLFGFENRHRIFAIDSRYRFAVICGAKGGRTEAVNAAFGRVDLADWERPTPPLTRYGRDLLPKLSPRSGAFVEADDERDLDLLRHMHTRCRPLVGDGGAFRWRQGDYNMTADRHRFVRRDAAEAGGFVRATDGIWRRGDEVLLPLYQGAMIYDLHPNAAVYRSGTGRATTWEAPRAVDDLRPQYLIAPDRALVTAPARIVLRALSNATNERSAITCLLPDVPCGNSLGVLTPRAPTATPLRSMAAGAALLGSLTFDYALRLRLSGTNLNHFVLSDCVLPTLDLATEVALANAALQLSAILPWHAPLWQLAAAEGWRDAAAAPACDVQRRDELLTTIDVLSGRAFGLTDDDVAWITRGCELPSETLRRGTPDGLPPRGFWRVERDRQAVQRRPNRWRVAARSTQLDVGQGQDLGAPVLAEDAFELE